MWQQKQPPLCNKLIIPIISTMQLLHHLCRLMKAPKYQQAFPHLPSLSNPMCITLSPMSSTSSLPTNSLKTPEITLPSKTLPSPVHPNPCLSSSTSVTVSSIPNTPAIATRTIFKQPTLPDPPEGKRT